jgi:hypothetical protein
MTMLGEIFFPPVHQFIYVLLEDMCVFCLELRPCSFHDVSICFESKARKVSYIQWPKEVVVTWGENGILCTIFQPKVFRQFIIRESNFPIGCHIQSFVNV